MMFEVKNVVTFNEDRRPVSWRRHCDPSEHGKPESLAEPMSKPQTLQLLCDHVTARNVASSWFSLYSTIKLMHGPINIRSIQYYHILLFRYTLISRAISSHSVFQLTFFCIFYPFPSPSRPIPLNLPIPITFDVAFNVIGIATGYGLDGPRIESRWRRDFPHLSRPALGSTQLPVQWVPGLFRE